MRGRTNGSPSGSTRGGGELSPSPQSVDTVAASLLRLRDKVARLRAGDLAALLVVTPTGAAYRHKDGVQVAPSPPQAGVAANFARL